MKTSLLVEFKGALTEQFVLQQIICETPYTPYYYGTDKATFEQDFPSRKVDSLFAAPYKDQEWMENIPLYAVCNL